MPKPKEFKESFRFDVGSFLKKDHFLLSFEEIESQIVDSIPERHSMIPLLRSGICWLRDQNSLNCELFMLAGSFFDRQNSNGILQVWYESRDAHVQEVPARFDCGGRIQYWPYDPDWVDDSAECRGVFAMIECVSSYQACLWTQLSLSA